MKNGTICKLHNNAKLICVNNVLYDIDSTAVVDLKSYNKEFNHYQISDLNIDEMYYDGVLIYKKSILNDTEKNIVKQLKNVGMVCLARDNDESLYAYPTDTITKKYSEWFVKDLTEYPIEYIRVNEELFKMITSKDLCPTKLIELEEERNDL